MAEEFKLTREKLIDAAVGVNEGYRCDEEDRDLEIGFLYGTAEMIVALTIGETESYSDLREEVAREIDKRAAVNSYPILPVNGWKEEKRKKNREEESKKV